MAIIVIKKSSLFLNDKFCFNSEDVIEADIADSGHAAFTCKNNHSHILASQLFDIMPIDNPCIEFVFDEQFIEKLNA